MLTLPDSIMTVLTPFAKAFSYRIWDMVHSTLSISSGITDGIDQTSPKGVGE